MQRSLHGSQYAQFTGWCCCARFREPLHQSRQGWGKLEEKLASTHLFVFLIRHNYEEFLSQLVAVVTSNDELLWSQIRWWCCLTADSGPAIVVCFVLCATRVIFVSAPGLLAVAIMVPLSLSWSLLSLVLPSTAPGSSWRDIKNYTMRTLFAGMCIHIFKLCIYRQTDFY